jgi:Flp pilus assembly protein TadG
MRQMLRFTTSKSGAVALEFALILPILVTLFFGSVEIANLTLCYLKVVNAAETVADLVTQQTVVSATDIDDIARAGKLILTPLPTAPFGVAIASVTFNASTGAAQVAWQDTRNSTAISNPAGLAAGYGEPSSSVVIVTASYTYTSPLSYFLTGPITLGDTAFYRPRQKLPIAHL